jgi:hypothetical protein
VQPHAKRGANYERLLRQALTGTTQGRRAYFTTTTGSQPALGQAVQVILVGPLRVRGTLDKGVPRGGLGREFKVDDGMGRFGRIASTNSLLPSVL